MRFSYAKMKNFIICSFFLGLLDAGCGTSDKCARVSGRCESEGASRCNGSALETCSEDAEGCLIWQFRLDCMQNDLACIVQNGIASCKDVMTEGCCIDDQDCGSERTCAEGGVGAVEGWGVCLPSPRAGLCWEDSDCDAGQQCHGAGYCGCLAVCDLTWWGPGVCVSDNAICTILDPSWVLEVCDAASVIVFDGEQCLHTCPGCCGCQGFCDLTFPSIEQCESACLNGSTCLHHDQCPDDQICMGVYEGSSGECGLCGQTDTCHCARPPWDALRVCQTDQDCETNMSCGDNCYDCPPCPRCVHGWCAWETFELVECFCYGCG